MANRKSLALALAVVFACGLVACSSTSEPVEALIDAGELTQVRAQLAALQSYPNIPPLLDTIAGHFRIAGSVAVARIGTQTQSSTNPPAPSSTLSLRAVAFKADVDVTSSFNRTTAKYRGLVGWHVSGSTVDGLLLVIAVDAPGVDSVPLGIFNETSGAGANYLEPGPASAGNFGSIQGFLRFVVVGTWSGVAVPSGGVVTTASEGTIDGGLAFLGLTAASIRNEFTVALTAPLPAVKLVLRGTIAP